MKRKFINLLITLFTCLILAGQLVALAVRGAWLVLARINEAAADYHAARAGRFAGPAKIRAIDAGLTAVAAHNCYLATRRHIAGSWRRLVA